MKALLKFYALEWDDLGLKIEEVPQVLLDVEKEELGISAGLQDRVIQTYGGLVHMDFDVDLLRRYGFGKYQPLPNVKLPPLYMCYNTRVGGDSGKVHSPIKERWLNGDLEVVNGMKELAALTDEGLTCLRKEDYSGFGVLMEKNFALRRSMYTDRVIGERNLEMIALAKEKGFAGKFTGSGGAIVCVKRSAPFELNVTQEDEVKKSFQQMNFEFVRLFLHANANEES